MNVKQLDHLNLSVTSLEATTDWYRRVFGFDVVERGTWNGHRWAIAHAGDAMLCMYERPGRRQLSTEERDAEALHGIAHYGLRITDRDAWLATVERERVAVEYGGAVEWPHSTSWYVLDPSGYEIEVAAWNDDRPSFG